jgi:hypothetical protein
MKYECENTTLSGVKHVADSESWAWFGLDQTFLDSEPELK